MSTANPFPAQIPPELMKIIDAYVIKKVGELAEQNAIAGVPKALTPHEQLQFHIGRAVAAVTGDQSPFAVSQAHTHTLSALALLTKEVEDLTAVSHSHSSASVDTSSSAVATETVAVTEGAI